MFTFIVLRKRINNHTLPVSQLSSGFKLEGNLFPGEDFSPLADIVRFPQKSPVAFGNHPWTPTVRQRCPAAQGKEKDLAGHPAPRSSHEISGLRAETGSTTLLGKLT